MTFRLKWSALEQGEYKPEWRHGEAAIVTSELQYAEFQLRRELLERGLSAITIKHIESIGEYNGGRS